MDEQRVEIYTAADSQQAFMLRNLLADCGITAEVTNTALQGASGEVPLGWATAPRLSVAAGDAKEARRILLDLESRGRANRTTADSANADDDGLWEDWPCCPRCGQRRQAICPNCEMAGDEFHLAEYLPAAEHLSRDGDEPGMASAASLPLLMCPACSEAFTANFYRFCPECGHDYGHGVSVEDTDHVLTWRAVLAMLGVAIAVAGVLVYFWLLF